MMKIEDVNLKKIHSIAYADDVILVANNETGLREVMRKFNSFIEKIGLELNVEKTKIMEFRKNAKRRRKNVEFKWKGSKIEIVKEVTYLGYRMQTDNGEQKHIENITKKAMAALGRIWHGRKILQRKVEKEG